MSDRSTGKPSAIPHKLASTELHSEHFKQILNYLPTQVWFKDVDENVLWVNQAACEFMGMNLDQMVGRNMADLLLKGDFQKVKEATQTIIKTGNPILGRIAQTQYHADGKTRCLKIDRIPVLSPDNQVTGILVFCSDITELHETQSKLHRTTRLFESFQHHSPIMNWAQDQDERYIMINHAYEEFLQIKASDLIGKTPGDSRSPILTSAVLGKAVETTREILSNDKPLEFEIQMTRNGKVHTLLVTKFPMDLGNNHKAVGGLAIDITKQKETQEQLFKVKQRYEFAINGTTDGLWDWDIGSYCWYSDRYKELLGYKPNDHFSNHIEDSTELIHVDDRPYVWEQVRRCLEDDARYDVEFRMKCKDGSFRWVRARAKAWRDEAGKAIRMSGSIQDVHDRVTAQLQLAKTNELLSIRNQELDQFAHIAAHDLRSPLRTITGFGGFLQEMFEEQWDNPQAKEYVKRLLNAASRMEGLIDSLLTFSRVGRNEMNYSPTDLNEIFELVCQDLKTEIDESGAMIDCQKLPTLECDALLIGLVLQNLLSNSIKYCVNKTPRIKVQNLSNEQEHIICVKDNGQGFSENDAQKVFEPFKRLSTPAREGTAGYGVGLSICKRIVERHGGRIHAESKAGLGACFYIHIP
ncbi:MAG: PAS domain S-box protein [Phycisphaeraceae bacterium JB051]